MKKTSIQLFMDTLPEELIYHLLTFVDGASLVNSVSLLDKRFRSYTIDELLWKEKCAGLPLDHRPPNHPQAWQFLWRSKNIQSPLFGVGTISQNETLYTGSIRDGLYHGFGVYTTKWAMYIGEWKNGKKNGHGRLRTGSQQYVLIGTFANDKIVNGKIVFDDGEHYVGELDDDVEHGKGTYTWVNGDTYTGLWNQGVKQGYGVYTWGSEPQKGDRYEGDWNNNCQTGAGTYWWNDGRVYRGMWRDHMRNEQGIFTFPDGATYEGTWLEGRRQGYGKQTWANGDCYDGLWDNDEPTGEIVKNPKGGVCRVWKGFFHMTKEEQRYSVASQ